MAAASPASSGKAGSDSSAAPPAVANGNGAATTPQKLPPASAFDMPKPNLRGLNKPKCIQCGNVARSRCPFQSCKSCCYKAQNPCHIHVLKQNNTLPDKPPPSTAPLSEQPSTNSPITGAASRLASMQRLPHHFLNALRTKKSLVKKDIVGINKWRFEKLKEHLQEDIDAENEAYERYTQNVGLLEETFGVTEDADVEPEDEPTSSEERMETLVSEAKVRLKSDSANADGFKDRIATILDQKIKELLESKSTYEDDNPCDQNLDGHPEPVKLSIKQQMERSTKMTELLAKMIRAQSEDDLKPCSGISSQLFGSNQESTAAATIPYSFPKLWTRLEIDDAMMSNINGEFSFSNEVMQL
uniref:Uncharacterized protein n=1 Tax=Leersia perrieri TaxID=77586 RepID=A0A0D9X417_9ORYZ